MAVTDRMTHIAILDSAELIPAGAGHYLSSEEFEEYACIRHERRRGEWLAGRTAAKWLFLEQERRGTAEIGATGLRQICRSDLAVFSSELYQSVAVARDQSPGGGAPRIGWRSTGAQVQVALSHAHGFAGASIGGVYSMDLEVPAPRIPAFYRHNFTRCERNWVAASVESLQVDSEWLYTLLWSAKECLLKTPLFRARTLWNMSSIEINIVAGSERLRAVQGSTVLSQQCQLLQFETSSGFESVKQFELAVGGTANLILAAMTKSRSD